MPEKVRWLPVVAVRSRTGRRAFCSLYPLCPPAARGGHGAAEGARLTRNRTGRIITVTIWLVPARCLPGGCPCFCRTDGQSVPACAARSNGPAHSPPAGKGRIAGAFCRQSGSSMSICVLPAQGAQETLLFIISHTRKDAASPLAKCPSQCGCRLCRAISSEVSMEDFNDKRQPGRTRAPRASRSNTSRRPRRTPAVKASEPESTVEVVVQPTHPQRGQRPARRRSAAQSAETAAPQLQNQPRPRRRSAPRARPRGGPARHPDACLPAGRPGRGGQEHHAV